MNTITYIASNFTASEEDVSRRITEYLTDTVTVESVIDHPGEINITFNSGIGLDKLRHLDSAMTSMGYLRIQPFNS